MKLLFITFLVAFLSANLILIEQNFILNKMDRYEFFCAKNIVLFLLIMFYMVFINKDVYKNLKDMEFKNWKYILFDCIITIINILLWYYLLQNSEAYKLVTNVNPMTIILTIILSYILYKKEIVHYEMYGVILVLIGLFLINKK